MRSSIEHRLGGTSNTTKRVGIDRDRQTEPIAYDGFMLDRPLPPYVSGGACKRALPGGLLAPH